MTLPISLPLSAGYVPRNVIWKDPIFSVTQTENEEAISTCQGFFGEISRDDAVTMLQTQTPGTYLIRSSHSGKYITFVQEVICLRTFPVTKLIPPYQVNTLSQSIQKQE